MLFAATHTAKAGTSVIGTALHPIFVLVGYVLAFFYGVVPNSRWRSRSSPWL